MNTRTNQIFKFLVIVLLYTVFIGCSSEDSSVNNGGNNGNPEQPDDILLSTIRSSDFHDLYDYPSDTLIYQNDKLVKALFFNCSGTMYQFEYGSNGMVSKYYIGHGLDYNDLDMDLSLPQNSWSKLEIEYDTQGKVIKNELYNRQDPNDINSEYELEYVLELEYDSQNRIYNVIYADEYETFSNIVTEFDASGNMVEDDGGYTYEYDDNTNPMYVLYQKYGLAFLETCNSLEMRSNYHVSPNNLKRVYNSDGELRYNAIYTYNSEGVPDSCLFVDESNDGYCDTETFTYL